MAAVPRSSPKPTRVEVSTASTTPSPPGVIGMAASTLARPNATSRSTGFTVPPNARRNTHSEAASSTQLTTAQPRLRVDERAVGGQLLEAGGDLADDPGRGCPP